MVEYFFNSSTNAITQIGTYTEATPNGQEFNTIRDLGDGVGDPPPDDQLDNAGTTQVTTKIADLRTTGVNLNLSGVSDANAQNYVAGTRFNDTFVGENSAINEYYYIGRNSVSGPAPTDCSPEGISARTLQFPIRSRITRSRRCRRTAPSPLLLGRAIRCARLADNYRHPVIARRFCVERAGVGIGAVEGPGG